MNSAMAAAATVITCVHSVGTVESAAAAMSLAIDLCSTAAVAVCRRWWRLVPFWVSTLLQVFSIASLMVGSIAAAGRPIHMVAAVIVFVVAVVVALLSFSSSSSPFSSVLTA